MKRKTNKRSKQKENKDQSNHITDPGDFLNLEWPTGMVWASIAVVSLTILFRYMIPVVDGDLWFHLAYARYFFEHQTIIPDHTVFSWTMSDNNSIYCAWFSEIILFVIHKIGGLNSLFVFRYLVVSIYALTFFLYAGKKGLIKNILLGGVCLLGITSSFVGIMLKPEIFSFLFFTITAALWFSIKSSKRSTTWCYAFPFIMVLWVNSHGVFIFGLLFLWLIGAGEYLNAKFSKTQAIESAGRRQLYISIILSTVAIILTPYGLKYPLHLLRGVIGKAFSSEGMADYNRISAYQSILTGYNWILWVTLVLISVILLLLIRRSVLQKKVDWGVILVNLVFAGLYCYLIRMTYYWVPIFSFSTLYLLSRSDKVTRFRTRWLQLAVSTVVIVACIAVSMGTVLGVARNNNFRNAWLGFGISHQNPVSEAEFIRKYLYDYKMGNTYSVGAYLLWSLWPKKVMIDARYFPYKQWFSDYQQHLFSNSEPLETFLSAYPADFYCIEYNKKNIINKFCSSDNWKTVCYGASSVVFLRADIQLPHDAERVQEDFYSIKSFDVACEALLFSLKQGDFDAASRLLDEMDANFKTKNARRLVPVIKYYMSGMQALKEGQYENAVTNLERANSTDIFSAPKPLNRAYHFLARDHWVKGNDKEAYRIEEKALKVFPNNPATHYNLGVIGWFIEKNSAAKDNGQWKNNPAENMLPATAEQVMMWRPHLEWFIATVGTKLENPGSMIEIAESILANTYDERPPFLIITDD